MKVLKKFRNKFRYKKHNQASLVNTEKNLPPSSFILHSSKVFNRIDSHLCVLLLLKEDLADYQFLHVIAVLSVGKKGIIETE